MNASPTFAVVDVETTGLFPGGHDRVIEIAIVRLDGRGGVLEEYSTLLNPGRDLGPAHIHGLRARDVLPAPEFGEVAGDILAMLRGAVFTGHNVRFDLGFVRAELARAEIQLPPLPSLCTMRLAAKTDPGIPGRSLEALCRHFGIALPEAHWALHDARAAARLLRACIERAGGPAESAAGPGALGVLDPPAASAPWPQAPRSGKRWRREDSASQSAHEVPLIAGLVSRLPAGRGCRADLTEYLALVDRILEDRRVTPQEAGALGALASELKIGAEEAAAAHERYLADLIGLALSDRVLSAPEEADLEDVRRLLGVPRDRCAAMIQEARSRLDQSPAQAPPPHAGELRGKSVCFTGALTCRIRGEAIDRDRAERMAAERGMVPKSGVARSLDFLVTADPDSLSGKAEKARRYGVRILAEPVFWQMVGVQID